MTKLQLRTVLTNAGVEMSNTTFKKTLLADLMAQVKGLSQDDLYTAEYAISQEMEFAEENQENAASLNEILCFITELLNAEKTPVATTEEVVVEPKVEVEVEIEDVEVDIEAVLPNPVDQAEVVVKAEPKVEHKKAEAMYFQHVRTLAVYRWVKNITIGKTEVVVFVTPDKKEHKVTRAIAKKMYRKVSVAFVKQLMATPKNKNKNQAVKNNPNEVTCEVNCKVVNGQRQWTVTGLKTARVVRAREGKSVTNIFKSYEVQIEGLKAKVTFTPDNIKADNVKATTFVAPF